MKNEATKTRSDAMKTDHQILDDQIVRAITKLELRTLGSPHYFEKPLRGSPVALLAAVFKVAARGDSKSKALLRSRCEALVRAGRLEKISRPHIGGPRSWGRSVIAMRRGASVPMDVRYAVTN